MAKKTRKCHWCNLDDTNAEDMEFVLAGITKPSKKFYHKECFSSYLVDKEFKDKERAEKDELVEVLKEIFGVMDIPRQAYPFIEALRNGEPVLKGQTVGKRYKEGYSYTLIKKTFEFCSESIKDSIEVINFGGFINAFKYALAIVVDKIYIVEQREEKRKKFEKKIKRQTKIVEEIYEDVRPVKPKKKSRVDISEFLDD